MTWKRIVWQLRPAFSREKTFLWFIVTIIGFCTRTDQLGISSFIRASGLGGASYECLRRFYRSTGVYIGDLTRLWGQLVIKMLKNHLVIVNGRIVLLIDGIKRPKEGRRMPGVKKLFHSSQNNTKPNYFFGHSCQAIHLLAKGASSFIAVPLAIRIQDGLDNRRGSFTLRALDLLFTLGNLSFGSYLVGDAYYWAGNLTPQLARRGIQLISRVRSNAVAFMLPETSKGKGRPKKYGKKVSLRNFFKGGGFIFARATLYGRNVDLFYKEKTLLSKNHLCPIKYVWVKFGNSQTIFCTTDTELPALKVIELYALRFKIECSFKEFVHDFGGFCYRFWSGAIDKSSRAIKRNARVEHSFHLYLQSAAIAQGITCILSLLHSEKIWKEHRPWMRTIRSGVLPSAAVVRITLQVGIQNFIKNTGEGDILAKFISHRRKVDVKKDVLRTG